jgi:hypothetical protein
MKPDLYWHPKTKIGYDRSRHWTHMPTTGFLCPLKLCKKSSSAACSFRWYSQTESEEDDSHEALCSPPVASCRRGLVAGPNSYVVTHAYVSRRILFHIWRIQWQVSVQMVDDLHSQVLLVLYFLFHGDAAAKVKTHRRLDDVEQVTQRLLLCNKTTYATSGIILLFLK